MARRGAGTDSDAGHPGTAAPDPDPDAAGAHPTAGLNETVHQRYRLGILAITSRSRQADFGYLREALGLTSGNLSTHLMVLEDAGLVQVEKGYEGRRPRTWVSITRQGRAALAAEMQALTRLVREHDAEQGTDMAGGSNDTDA